MAYQYLDNKEIEKALDEYLSVISKCHTLEAEEIPVMDALGRIASEAIYAKISSPHYNASAMDGISLRASSTFGASDTTPVFLEEGVDFIWVDTGDPVPDCYDTVVMVEDILRVEGEMTEAQIQENNERRSQIKLINAISPWQNIRQIGEDICKNDMILPSNTKIEAASIGAIMAGGVMRIPVWKKPLIGIIPTGDEIICPTANPKEGEIIEFNSSVFSAILQPLGANTKLYPIVPDEKGQIRKMVESASKKCDIILLIAGSSAGREDFSSAVLKESGDVFIHGIAIRPGKPTILAIINERPVIGVPGYPVSGIIVIEKIVKKVLASLMNQQLPAAQSVMAFLTRNVVSSLKYKEYVRVKLGNVGGRMIATPLNRGAAVITSFVKADGLLEIPLNSQGYPLGNEVQVELLKDKKIIENAVMVTGSHDPLIDVMTDLLCKKKSGFTISSSHVGSMGGIMAIRRKESHLAGIHLLDEKTGFYNKSFIEEYFEKGTIALIIGLKRRQGFLVAPGNPKKIRTIQDICDAGREIRYVNRQRGSGTRILFDYLLEKQQQHHRQLVIEDIYGYAREEFTHMNVAAIIASGNADAGLGIYSAAIAFGLDFIPVCEEQYDFITPVEFLDEPKLKVVIELLKSEDFKDRIFEMGGYIIDDNIGNVFVL